MPPLSALRPSVRRRVAAILAASPMLAACSDDGGSPMDPTGQPNAPPVAAFTADQDRGTAPLTVSFDASASTDPDGSIASYMWSFGDGTTGSGADVEHVYQTPGLYTATLTVTDDRGARAMLSGGAIVVDSPPGSGTNTVSGFVWHDVDADGTRGAGEAGIHNLAVFLDLDDDGERDEGEPVVFTDETGGYVLAGVEDGSHSVAQDLPLGWTNTVAMQIGGPATSTSRHPWLTRDSAEPDAASGAAAAAPQGIIGGSLAAASEFPFQVALVFEPVADNEDAFTCGGTLIAGSWVVTAAHCVDQRPAPLQVLIGTNDLRSGGQRVDIARTIIYPAFNTNAFVANDIALLELDGFFMLPRVELMSAPKLALANPGTLATVIGWGRTSTSGAISPELKKLELEIISNDTCKTTLEDEVTDATICAGERGQPEGVCSGDSGGPLLVPGEDGWVQAGIVSFGIFTCVLPEAFARVSSLIDFVLRTVPTEPSLAVPVALGGGETVEVEFGNFR